MYNYLITDYGIMEEAGKFKIYNKVNIFSVEEKNIILINSKLELTAWIDSQKELREAAKIDDKDDFETIVEKINVYFDKDSISVNE